MIKSKITVVYLSIVFLTIPIIAKANTPTLFEVIMGRVKDGIKGAITFKNEDARKKFETLQADGSWADVDYSDKTITNWIPTDHLIKQQILILSYINPKSPFYQNKEVYNGIVNSFKYWVSKDPQSSNWWHNQIGAPRYLGESLILMRFGQEKIPADLENSVIEMMKKGDPFKQEGANKTDIALHFFYRALLTEDKDLLGISVEQLFNPIKLVDGNEGLQYDNSYLQHGPQLQISSYGHVFIEGISKMAKYVRDTPYALSADKVEMFSNYYRNSYLKVIRGQYIDFNVEGRGVSRENILRKRSEKFYLKSAKLLDPVNTKEWDAAIARTDGSQAPGYEVKPSHTHYWKADYTTHIRPNYSFNVRIASSRTKRSEAGNGENLLGRYLSDGVTNIQVHGPEYFNIMPVWEWDKIPGVTNRDHVKDKPMTKFWGEYGANEFAGGVSNNYYGVSAYALDYDSVKAKKAWFFFDKEIVCLGTDINSVSPENITTTVNQNWLTGKVESSLGVIDSNVNNKSLFNNNKPNWILHNDVGYYFPKGGNVTISTGKQEGNWYTINSNNTNIAPAKGVFKLWFNHGFKPANSSYSYIVLPAVTKKEIKAFKPSKVNIIANSSKIQAVYHDSLKMVQIAFYEAQTLKLPSLSITVDKPCILILTNLANQKIEVFVADPLQKATDLKVTLQNLKTGIERDLIIDLPTDYYKGSTKSATVQF